MRVFVVRGFPVAVSLLHYDCYDWTLFMMGNGGRLGLDFSIPSLHSGFLVGVLSYGFVHRWWTASCVLYISS